MSIEKTLVAFTFDSKQDADNALDQLKLIDFVDTKVKIVASAFATKVSNTEVVIQESELSTAQKVAGAAGIGVLTAGLIANPLGWVVGGIVGGSVMSLFALLNESDMDDKLLSGVGNKLETGQTALFLMFTGKLSESMLDLMREYDADLAFGVLSDDTVQATEKLIEDKEEAILKKLNIRPKRTLL